jgi:acetolactate synthase-1/2/3 large subunit
MVALGHNARRSGAEVLAEMLAGYGVTHVFMVPAVLRRTLAEMERRTNIARIHCHGENPARTGAPGPVHLQFRDNEGQIDAEEAEMEALVELQFAHVPPFRPAPEQAHVQAALDLLQQAERPIIVAGGGVRASGAQAELVAFAEVLQIPVATSLNGKDNIPGAHPLSIGVVGSYSRESANLAVNRADLVCFIGTETGGMTTHFWAVPKIGIPAIQIDIEAEALGRNYPLAASVLGDARAVLLCLLDAADRASAKRRESWIREIAALRADWYANYDPLLKSTAVPIHPGRICRELSLNVPEDAVVVVDTGHAGMWMGGMYDLRAASQSYMRSAGHLGWAFPAGLGAKAACPQRPVIVFTGDAGFWYHIGEIETAVRWNLNSVTVVNNNGGGNQSKRGFDRAYGGQQTERARELWTYRKVNFAQLAENIGAIGLRVEQPSDIAPAISRALTADRPVIVDVVTDIGALAPTAVT